MKKIIFIIFSCLFVSAGAVADNGSESGAPYTDHRNFTTNTQVKVWLNYESFKSEDFVSDYPSFTQANLESAIRICIDNWIQISGMRLRVTYAGLTKNTLANDREILIQARPKSSSGALGSGTNNVMNQSHISIYKTDENDNAFDWIVFPDGSTTIVDGRPAFIHTLMHEMGHSFGLSHNLNADGVRGEKAELHSIMYPNQTEWTRFGPFAEDVEDLIDLYGYRDDLTLDVLRSTDQGISWQSLATNIGSIAVRTTLPVQVSRDDSQMILFYSTREKKPAWIYGTSSGATWGAVNNHTTVGHVLGGEHSLYGTAGHGYNNEYMMAWVDPRDNNVVKVVFSTDNGETWRWKNPIGHIFLSHAGGTPAIQKLANNTWILSYVKIEDISWGDSGKIVSRISTDDGSSWGDETELYSSEKFRGVRGVTITATGTDKIRIGFSTVENYDQRASAITTITAHLNTANQLVADSWEADRTILTDSEPSFTATTQKFLMAYRPQTGELYSRNSSYNSRWWINPTAVDNTRYITPATVTARLSSPFAFMFRLSE